MLNGREEVAPRARKFYQPLRGTAFLSPLPPSVSLSSLSPSLSPFLPSPPRFSSSIKYLQRVFKTPEHNLSTEENVQGWLETLPFPSHPSCRIVNCNISNRSNLNFGGVGDYDLQRRGDTKQLFLETAK